MFREFWLEQLGAGTSTVCSELRHYEVCIENMSRSIRGWRSGSRDNEYSLHTQMSLAISQMKIENAFITSPGTDRNKLPSAPCQGQFLTLAKASPGLAELEIASVLSTPMLPFYIWGN